MSHIGEKVWREINARHRCGMKKCRYVRCGDSQRNSLRNGHCPESLSHPASITLGRQFSSDHFQNRGRGKSSLGVMTERVKSDVPLSKPRTQALTHINGS